MKEFSVVQLCTTHACLAGIPCTMGACGQHLAAAGAVFVQLFSGPMAMCSGVLGMPGLSFYMAS